MRAIFNRCIKMLNDYRSHQLTKAKIIRLLKEFSPIYLEVGAGNKNGENGWLTLDAAGDSDLNLDLRDGIPFPDESISKLYSSHFLEHLSYTECQLFLIECKRVLIPGGNMSICVPDSRIYIEAYCLDKYLDQNLYFRYKPAFNNTTKIDYINHRAYMNGEHKYMFNMDN